jgi:hypothetical protein
MDFIFNYWRQLEKEATDTLMPEALNAVPARLSNSEWRAPTILARPLPFFRSFTRVSA